MDRKDCLAKKLIGYFIEVQRHTKIIVQKYNFIVLVYEIPAKYIIFYIMQVCFIIQRFRTELKRTDYNTKIDMLKPEPRN